MPKCIAVVYAAALNLFGALFGALFARSKGRHRNYPVRRRARRVRPYARPRPAVLPPAQTARPARPTLNPPTEPVPADEVALVRPYYAAHEHDLAQQRALVRLRAWGADLPDPAEARTHTTRAYTLDEYGAAFEQSAATADTFHVPAPRAHVPRMSARVDELPHLSRLRRAQQERRSGCSGLSRATV
ncbi:hypothetical protein IDM40_25565 [Nocardiopsis sp. HNM0947]|uniref:Secreted protein n=1 Tax=Nocardiopsis coralli TaxID=2772213 RepID=A0ABR9PDX6_9ACTN|nr:hypothetical protein [Nocardiopsis coralli]MBE3002040.1 hypothetical protein [Nocardiopsis coralli]